MSLFHHSRDLLQASLAASGATVPVALFSIRWMCIRETVYPACECEGPEEKRGLETFDAFFVAPILHSLDLYP